MKSPFSRPWSQRARTAEHGHHEGAGALARAAALLCDGPNRLTELEVARLASLGLVTGGIAHDLGNHLAVVASAIRLIKQNLAPTSALELRPLTDAAMTALERAATMNRDILDLSRSSSDNEIVFLDAIIAAGLDRIMLAVGPAITVELSKPERLPAVFCNSRELENVIFNLVINARDAMPEGGVLTLNVFQELIKGQNTRLDEVAPSHVVLRVTDTGCGIPSDVTEKVFRPFFSTKPIGQGTGLGLAIVSDFVRRLGGSAEIESAVGRGTTVTVRLPACGS